jgi:hypothetical protein
MLGRMKLNLTFFNKKMKSNPYTILLQGRISEETLNLWIQNHSESDVVLSIWEDEDLSKFDIPKNWKVVVNHYPFLRFAPNANLDYQIITTLRGLEQITTKWVIKMRCDEYWSNLDKIFQKMLNNEDKIVSGSMFFRKWGMYPFHCGDKIMGGTKDNLTLMFESTLHNLEIRFWNETIPESQLGFGYIIAKENSLNNDNVKEVINQMTFNRNKPKQSVDDITSAIYKGLEITTQKAFSILAHEFNYSAKKIYFDDIKGQLDYMINILSNLSNNIKDMRFQPLDDKSHMKKWFDIIDVNELKPYVATRNFGGTKGRVWYRNDFPNEIENCMTDINQ